MYIIEECSSLIPRVISPGVDPHTLHKDKCTRIQVASLFVQASPTQMMPHARQRVGGQHVCVQLYHLFGLMSDETENCYLRLCSGP